MIKIIGEHGTGKTKDLLEFAARENKIVICKDPARMSIKAQTYGYPGLTFISYDFYTHPEGIDFTNKQFVIDDLDDFLRALYPEVKGYTVSID